MRKRDREARLEHERWLRLQGLDQTTLRIKHAWNVERRRERILEGANLSVSQPPNLVQPGGNIKYYPARDLSYRKVPLDGVTIAPAYNKGPYMVILRDDVKDIGRK